MSFFNAKPAEDESPEPRCSHESALIGDELHLFGGRKGKFPYNYFSRNEIWTCNVRKEKKWIRRFAKGKNIPPPCEGAQCVVINGIMYSYGGVKEDGEDLGEVFGLDPMTMQWIQVATPMHRKKPWQRSYCCLWAIGRRMIMFGGYSENIPEGRLQSGAKCIWGVNNEVYEFAFEERREKGCWLDDEFSGKRPQPRQCAATETIDQYRGLLHGGYDGNTSFDDAFVIDLRKKKWICIHFYPKPSAQYYHRLCKLVKRGFEEKNCFLMIGGHNKDSGYIIDFDQEQSHKIDLTPVARQISRHTLHCVANQDGSAHVIISGGEDGIEECQEMMKIFTLGPQNESYTNIESLLLTRSTLLSSPGDQESILYAVQQMERMREQYKTLRADKSKIAARYRDLQEQVERQSAHFQDEKRRFEAEKLEKEVQFQHLQAQCKTLETEKNRLNAERHTFESRQEALESEINDIRRQAQAERQTERQTFESVQKALESEINKIRKQLQAERQAERQTFESQQEALESEINELRKKLQTERLSSESQRQTLQQSLEESQRSLDQFVQVLSINPQDIQLTEKKLGAGAYADVLIGYWHGMHVAVKQFHTLITTDGTIPLFRREVLTASRLHHPNIVRVCGAIMRPGLPFQIISEILEGSVSEVIDAAHSSGSYLSKYEQLSIGIEMTSAITYLHKLHPRPYVHGDIRPTNVLVTRDMRVKVADLGSAHLLDSSLSTGPMSPQYVAPERLSPLPARSSLSTDVYSLGVSLIEIFTGMVPIPDERNCQLSRLLEVDRVQLHGICARMIGDQESRPKSSECLEALTGEIAELLSVGTLPMKRLVKGTFEGEGEKRRHKVVLSENRF